MSTSIHYNDVIMGTMASQINSLTIVYSNVYSGADQRKHQSSASLAFITGFYVGNSRVANEFPAQRAVTRKMFPFDDVIMTEPRNTCTRCPFVLRYGLVWLISPVFFKGTLSALGDSCNPLGVSKAILNTVRCRFNAINFLRNPHNRHPIARP